METFFCPPPSRFDSKIPSEWSKVAAMTRKLAPKSQWIFWNFMFNKNKVFKWQCHMGWNILLKQTNQNDRADNRWKIYELEGWKKSRYVPSFSSVVQTIETDSNILDEYAAENEWNFSKISKMNRPSHQRWKKWLLCTSPVFFFKKLSRNGFYGFSRV
jgi:hypothetical protein